MPTAQHSLERSSSQYTLLLGFQLHSGESEPLFQEFNEDATWFDEILPCTGPLTFACLNAETKERVGSIILYRDKFDQRFAPATLLSFFVTVSKLSQNLQHMNFLLSQKF